MGGFGLFATFATDEWGPGKYTLDAYVRSDSDGPPALGTLQLTLKGTGPAWYPSASNPSSASGWVRVRVVVEVGAGEHLAAALVGGYSDATVACMLVDDITLVRE